MEPSKRIVDEANQTLNVTDARGRIIEFRKPNALDTLRLLKAAGPELSKNDAWLSMAILAFTVGKIDAIPTPQPSSEAQIENIIAKLGDIGVTAIAEALESTHETSETSLGN
jgi:hypothetical protein